ncbi:hypothetical protein Patl1_18742 [Pistacia atlantica]|uniref:Uncharacterized protein n=1 Tax=Pistacia atlantica TaxID=434234 RepID=A0ACC1C2Q0_9ROSI|nr:hypothetical protein Patl1_18742 [Pistacia atlantica]
MKILNPKFPFLVLLIILAACQLSSSRYLHTTTSEETSTEFHPTFSWHFPAKAPESSGKEATDPLYGVSYRTVPGGPNPLHN